MTYAVSDLLARNPHTPLGAVPAVSMDGLLHNLGVTKIGALKLDIEDTERELFGPAPKSGSIASNAPSLKLHDRYRPECAKAFYSALAKWNFARR
jgi:hypothetical protein